MRRVKVVGQEDFDGRTYQIAVVLELTMEEVRKRAIELDCMMTGEGFQNGTELLYTFASLVESLDELPERR